LRLGTLCRQTKGLRCDWGVPYLVLEDDFAPRIRFFPFGRLSNVSSVCDLCGIYVDTIDGKLEHLQVKAGSQTTGSGRCA